MITELGVWLKNQKIMSTWFLNDPLIWGLFNITPYVTRNAKNKDLVLNKTEKTAFSVQASGQVATAMQLQCNCNATAMQLQCNCNAMIDKSDF